MTSHSLANMNIRIIDSGAKSLRGLILKEVNQNFRSILDFGPALGGHHLLGSVGDEVNAFGFQFQRLIQIGEQQHIAHRVDR